MLTTPCASIRHEMTVLGQALNAECRLGHPYVPLAHQRPREHRASYPRRVDRLMVRHFNLVLGLRVYVQLLLVVIDVGRPTAIEEFLLSSQFLGRMLFELLLVFLDLREV